MIPVSSNIVQFKDRSVGLPVSWAWDFGDGGASTERNPIHTYVQLDVPQEFTTTLTVTDAHGVQSTVVKTLRIAEATRAAASEIWRQSPEEEIVGDGPIDFGTVSPNTPYDIVVEVRNTDPSVLLTVSDVQVTGAYYSITSALSPASIAPGDTGYLTLSVDVPSYGTHTGTLTITSNAEDPIRVIDLTSNALVGYLELPFYNAYAYVTVLSGFAADTSIHGFRGTLQLWEDGTVQFAGEIRATQAYLGRFYRVWVGTSETVGSYVDIAGFTQQNVWTSITTKVVKLNPGEKLYFVFGDINGIHYVSRREVITYPDGWQYPFTINMSSDVSDPLPPSQSYHWLTLDVGKTADPTDTVAYGQYSAQSSVGGLFAYLVDSDAGWANLNTNTLFNQTASNSYTTPPPSGGYQFGAPSTPPEQGRMMYAFLARSVSNQVRGAAYLGLFNKTATPVQYGTPPAVT